MHSLRRRQRVELTVAVVLTLLAAAALGLVACKGGDLSDDPGAANDQGTNGADAGGPDAAGACANTPVERRVWTLSRGEYDNSVKAVFGDTSGQAAANFPPESRANGFSKNPEAEVVDSNRMGLMMTAAETIAAAIVTAEVAFVGKTLACSLATSPSAGSPDPCAVSYIQNRGAALFRRPLTQAETDDLYATYLAGLANPYDGTSATSSGIELVVATLLQMPQFFYRTELGAPGETGATVELTQYEIASEIALMATGSPPDATLLAAAASGALTDGAALVAQYQRLVATPEGHAQMQRFVLEWLGEDSVAERGTATGPVSPELAQAMQAETAAFVDEAVFRGAGTVQELLTANYTFANTELATFYGLPADGLSSSASKVTLPAASGRAGLLSQGAFLLNASGPGVPILHRGKIIRNKVLCEQLPSFASVGLGGFTPSPFPTPPAGTTTRAGLSSAISGVCASCHQYFQSIGFGLEHFDAWGRFQDTENGGKVDPSGQLLESSSVDPASGLILDPAHFTKVDFADLPGLAAKLAAEPRVGTCFASQVVSFAAGRATRLDECAAADVQHAPNGVATIPQQLANYVQSKAFVTRTR